MHENLTALILDRQRWGDVDLAAIVIGAMNHLPLGANTGKLAASKSGGYISGIHVIPPDVRPDFP
jgi:hypothetical protein